MDESHTDEAEYSRKVASGRRVAGAIRFLVNAKSLQLECTKVLHVIAGASSYIWGRDNNMKEV